MNRTMVLLALAVLASSFMTVSDESSLTDESEALDAACLVGNFGANSAAETNSATSAVGDSVDITSLKVEWDSGDTVGASATPPEEKIAASAATEVSRGSFSGVEGDHFSILNSSTNGSMPGELLTRVSWAPHISGYMAAVQQLETMNQAYRSDTGMDLQLNNMYRSGYQGRSFHGWGLAVDFDSPNGGLMYEGDPQFAWLTSNAHLYGFYHPFWAGSGGSSPEAWHWEIGTFYSGGGEDCATRCPDNRPLWIGHKG